MFKSALPAVIIALASLTHAATITNSQGGYCGHLLHGPFVAATFSCQAPTPDGSTIALSNFYEGNFSAPDYPGYPPPTFTLFTLEGSCSGAMSGDYVNGQVIATFSGTCADGSLFSGSTVQQIATVQHYEGGGRVGRRLVTSYLITSGSTTVN